MLSQKLIDATLTAVPRLAGSGSIRGYGRGQGKAGQSRVQRGDRLLLATHALEEGGESYIHVSFFLTSFASHLLHAHFCSPIFQPFKNPQLFLSSSTSVFFFLFFCCLPFPDPPNYYFF